jgi:hypothetical protein
MQDVEQIAGRAAVRKNNTLRLIFFDFELPNSMVEMNAAEGADPIFLMAGYITNAKFARFPFGKAPELNVFDRWNRDREKFSPPNKVAKDCRGEIDSEFAGPIAGSCKLVCARIIVRKCGAARRPDFPLLILLKLHMNAG